MTYRDLLNQLSKLNDEQLDCQDATIYVGDVDEHYPITGMRISKDDDRLDDGHVVLEAVGEFNHT